MEALEREKLINQDAFRRREVSSTTLISNLTTDPNFYVFLGPVLYLLLFILIYTRGMRFRWLVCRVENASYLRECTW